MYFIFQFNFYFALRCTVKFFIVRKTFLAILKTIILFVQQRSHIKIIYQNWNNSLNFGARARAQVAFFVSPFAFLATQISFPSLAALISQEKIVQGAGRRNVCRYFIACAEVVGGERPPAGESEGPRGHREIYFSMREGSSRM